MGRIDLIDGDWDTALAALGWQVDLGVDTALQEMPVNRYETVAAAPVPATVPIGAGPSVPSDAVDAVTEAERAALQATSLPALRDALAGYPHCELRLGARNLVFSAGRPGARVMVVGEAPDIDDDRQGTPFAGAKGRLLDAMFASIGLARGAETIDEALYLTCALPWKPPGDRAPEAGELAMLRPFLHAHIALAGPEIIVAMGTAAAAALFPDAVLSRGGWGQVQGRPLLVMQHTGALLRTPAQKREAWADLLALQARLRAKKGA